ncbi:TPA: hypothetical protein ACF2DD_002073 [Clostridium perfringens]|nr:hypothetical protein [Clostridium perfringens]
MLFCKYVGFMREENVYNLIKGLKSDYILNSDVLISFEKFEDSSDLWDFLNMAFEQGRYGIDENLYCSTEDIINEMKNCNPDFYINLFSELKKSDDIYKTLEKHLIDIARKKLILKLESQINILKNEEIGSIY